MKKSSKTPIKPDEQLDVSHLRAARALLNWTQSTASEKIGITQASLSMIEQGAVDPRHSTFAKIADTYRKAGIEFKSFENGIFVGRK